MSDPTIEDLKALQARLGTPDHVVWLGPSGFVIAHTDAERAAIDLGDCDLHGWLQGLDAPPEDPGYYIVVPHEADSYSESYMADPWDFWPLLDNRRLRSHDRR